MGYQKNDFFFFGAGYEVFLDIFFGEGVIEKLDYIWGSFLCILGVFSQAQGTECEYFFSC